MIMRNLKTYSRIKTPIYQLENTENFQFKGHQYANICSKTEKFQGKIALIGRATNRQREILLVDTQSAILKSLCQALEREIESACNIHEKLNTVIRFVAEQFPEGIHQDKVNVVLKIAQDKTQNIFNEEAPIISLELFLEAKAGSCHHFALLTACLLDHLIQKKILPEGTFVNLHRNDTLYGRSCWVTYITNDEIFLIDAAHYPEALSLTNQLTIDKFGLKTITSLKRYYEGTLLELNLNIDFFAGLDENDSKRKSPEFYLQQKFEFFKKRVIEELEEGINFITMLAKHDESKQALIIALQDLMKKFKSSYQYDQKAYQTTFHLADFMNDIKSRYPELNTELAAGNTKSVAKKTLQAIVEIEEDFLHDISASSMAILIQKISNLLIKRLKELEEQLPREGSFFDVIYPKTKKKIKQDKMKGLQAILSKIHELYPIGSAPKIGMLSFEEIIDSAISSLDSSEQKDTDSKRIRAHLTKGTVFHHTRDILTQAEITYNELAVTSATISK